VGGSTIITNEKMGDFTRQFRMFTPDEKNIIIESINAIILANNSLTERLKYISENNLSPAIKIIKAQEKEYVVITRQIFSEIPELTRHNISSLKDLANLFGWEYTKKRIYGSNPVYVVKGEITLLAGSECAV